MSSDLAEFFITVIREGGPLGVALLFCYVLLQLVRRLESRLAELFTKLLDVTQTFQASQEKTASCLQVLSDDMREIRQNLMSRKTG
jgi:hypothetical protein